MPSKTKLQHYYVVGTEGVVSSGPAQIHYFGGYVSFSTSTEDCISTAGYAYPYRVFDGCEEYVSQSEPEIVPDIQVAGHLKEGWEVHHMGTYRLGTEDVPCAYMTKPVYETRLVDVTPEAKPLGKPLKVGDKVKRFGYSHDGTGVLAELSDTHVVIDYDDGRHMYAWSHGVIITRA